MTTQWDSFWSEPGNKPPMSQILCYQLAFMSHFNLAKVCYAVMESQSYIYHLDWLCINSPGVSHLFREKPLSARPTKPPQRDHSHPRSTQTSKKLSQEHARKPPNIIRCFCPCPNAFCEQSWAALNVATALKPPHESTVRTTKGQSHLTNHRFSISPFFLCFLNKAFSDLPAQWHKALLESHFYCIC